MRMTKKECDDVDLTMSEARYASKIVSQDIKAIMLKMADAILVPNAFTNEGVSLDAHSKSCDIYSPEAIQHDLLGWIVKISYRHWSDMPSGRKSIGYLISMYIDSHIRTTSAGKMRLMTLGDTGYEYASRYLKEASECLHSTDLPVLFRYAKDYESEEDKIKRQEKTAARKAKLLTQPS